jgi:hypothetical protein
MGSTVPLKRLFFLTLITALCGTGALAVLALLSGNFEGANGRVIATTGLLALYSLMAMPAGILIERASSPLVAWATLGLALGSLLYALALVWEVTETWEPVVGLSVFAAASSQTAALTALTDEKERGFLYIASWVLAFSAAGLLGWMVLQEDYTLWHLIAAVVVTDVVFALIQPLVRRMRAIPAGAAEAAASKGYRVVFALDSEPSLEELEAAHAALAAAGARLETIERPA